jgi:hypothetical protein
VKNENWDTNCVEGQSNINPQEAFYVGVNVQACHPNGLHLVWRADVRNKASCDMKLAADRQLSEGAGITTQVSANVTNMDWPNGQAGNATMTYNPATLNCGSVHLWGAFWASGPQSSNLNAGNTGYHVVLNYGKDCGATTPTPTAAPDRDLELRADHAVLWGDKDLLRLLQGGGDGGPGGGGESAPVDPGAARRGLHPVSLGNHQFPVAEFPAPV